jgi:chromosome segregation ATPase
VLLLKYYNEGGFSMSDNELLLAISNIVSSQIEPLKQDIKSIKQDMQSTKQDIQSTKQDIQSTKQDIQFTKILIENDILPRLQNIEACYTSTYNRYANGIEKLDAVIQDIDILKKVVTEHSEKLQKIG